MAARRRRGVAGTPARPFSNYFLPFPHLVPLGDRIVQMRLLFIFQIDTPSSSPITSSSRLRCIFFFLLLPSFACTRGPSVIAIIQLFSSRELLPPRAPCSISVLVSVSRTLRIRLVGTNSNLPFHSIPPNYIPQNACPSYFLDYDSTVPVVTRIQVVDSEIVL